jgi:hypoxanthine phosphoribosyltransferase
MKVIDITYDDLDQFYDTLANQVFNDKNSRIAIVGIANSGIYLSEGLLKSLQKHGFTHSQSLAVECKRPHSKYTDAVSTPVTKRILKILPRSFSNLLRILEHNLLGHTRPTQRTLIFRDHADQKLENFDRILIIDDAVDSGHSMKAVADQITLLAPKSKIETAAFTVTQRTPVIMPDWYAHTDVIIRFPWAVDSQ